MVSTIIRPEHGDIREIDGVEHVWEACGRCSGTGSYGPLSVDGGICFDCRVYSRRLGSYYGSGGRWVNKADFDKREARNTRQRAARQAKREAFLAGEADRYAQLVDAHPLLAELTYLGNVNFDADHGPANYDGILGSLRLKFEQYGSLSDKQIVFAEKIIREDMARTAQREEADRRHAAARAAREQNDADAIAAGVRVPVGEVTVLGTVVSTRAQPNAWGRTESKMTVVADEGWRIWVTMPAAWDLERGDRIELTVTVDGPKDGDDPLFGYGKRPRVLRKLSPNESPTTT